MVTETSALGDVGRRLPWLDASLELVAALRDQGLEIVGYAWWPLFDLVAWDYREGVGPVEAHLARMGLYDLEPDEIGTPHRRPRRSPTGSAPGRCRASGKCQWPRTQNVSGA